METVELQLAAERAAKYLTNSGYEVLYVSLYGSQNYGIDTPNSDRDWKAVVLPSLEDIIKNKKPVSKTCEFEGGLIDVKDVRLMFECYKKQNVNFIETLFTSYRWENANYAAELNYLFNKLNNKIAFADPVRALKCMLYMSKEKHHALCHPYPSKVELIDKYGYDGKQLSHIYRLNALIKSYIEAFKYNLPYKLILSVENDQEFCEFLRDTKSMELVFSACKANEYAGKAVKHSEQLVNEFLQEFEGLISINEQAYENLEQIKYDCMVQYFGNQLK